MFGVPSDCGTTRFVAWIPKGRAIGMDLKGSRIHDSTLYRLLGELSAFRSVNRATRVVVRQAIYELTVLKYLHSSANDPLGFAFQTATIQAAGWGKLRGRQPLRNRGRLQPTSPSNPFTKNGYAFGRTRTKWLRTRTICVLPSAIAPPTYRI